MALISDENIFAAYANLVRCLGYFELFPNLKFTWNVTRAARGPADR